MVYNQCKFCGCTIGPFYPSQIKKFCSSEHRYSYQSQHSRGKNNNNYGNKWSKEQREKGSYISKKRMADPDMRLKAGKANRGKKFSQERINKMFDHRDSDWATKWRKPISTETRMKIGEASSKRNKDPNYQAKVRNSREKNGQWIPISLKTDYDVFYEEANWVERMWDIIPDPNNLLIEIGIFKPNKNNKGAVRDHILSRKTGFEFGIFPLILRHPTNCQIISHSDNLKKKKKRYVDDDHHSINELFNKIKNYDKPWKEQEECLKMIELYETGMRWSR